MNLKYLYSIVCLGLTLVLGVCPAGALDKDKSENQSLASGSLNDKEYTRSLNHYILGVYCENLGDLDGAVGEYQKALKTDPASPLLHLNLATVYIQKDNPAAAIEELKQSAGLAPEAVEPHALLALVYAVQQKKDLATQEYTLALKNAVKLDPKNIEIYKSLGLIYLQQKKIKEAEGIFKLIAGMAPKDAQTHFFLGSIYFEAKDYSAVEKELKIALKLKPDFHEALNFLGYFYLEQDKNIDAAGAMIKKALVFDPENGAYIDSLGWFYFKKGRFKEALAELEKAASLLDDPEIYDHLGEVFLKLGNRISAKLNWEKSLKLDSQQEKIKAKLLKLTNGK